MLEFKRAWEQGKQHFIVVVAEEAPLSVEASTTLDSPDLTQFASHEPIRTNGECQTSVSKRQQES